MGGSKTANFKFVKVFSLKSFPLYGNSLSRCTVKLTCHNDHSVTESYTCTSGPGMVSASVTGRDNQIRREFINLRCTEIEDFKELCHQVADIGDWYGLCLNLGVYDDKLNELKHSNERIGERKQECLRVYFDTGEAYWEEVVRAIIQHPVRKGRVAKKIIEEKSLRSDLLDIIKSHAKLICD